jgi:hypothetical protein
MPGRRLITADQWWSSGLSVAGVVDYLIVEVGCEPVGLPGHPPGGWGVAGDAVDGCGEVECFLDGPDLLVLVRRVDLRWVADGDPADRDRGAPGGRTVLTWTTPWIRISLPEPAADPGNKAAPVARKQPSPTCAPLTWACGPMRTSSPMTHGCRARPRRTAFSITTLRAPRVIWPSSAVSPSALADSQGHAPHRGSTGRFGVCGLTCRRVSLIMGW